MNCGILGALLLGLVAAVSAQDVDPIKNFCRRIDHSSTVRNGTLYINGGLQSFKNVNSTTGAQYGNITVGINEYLVKIDLTNTWDWKNSSFKPEAIPKNNTNYELQPPNLSRAALYAGPANDTKLYYYGGTVDLATNVSFPGYMPPTSNQYSLWSYETQTGVWATADMSSDTALLRPASGASAEAPELGLGFWFNGEQDRGSSTESANLWTTVKFLKGMVVLDFNSGKARNLSTDAVSDLARVRGEMVYIPGVGEKGILVLIGGGEKGSEYLDEQPYGTLVSMGVVDIFDVASLYNESTPNGVWYSQKTSGPTPGSRMDFCLVVASASDGSSHNIYMHGGRGVDGNTYYDDIYVLSLPSFTWTQVYVGQAYRYGMKCVVGGNRQMITIGGSQEGKWTSNCDWETGSVGIYDMSTLEWGPDYFADAAAYQVPKRVYDSIGGNGDGGATTLAPSSGFTNSGIELLFTGPVAANSTSTGVVSPTSTSSQSGSPSSESSSSNGGAIAGGVIGGLAGIALIGAGILFLRRRRRRVESAESGPFIEASSTQLYEKDSSVPKVNHELQGDGTFPEGTVPLAEMPGGISTHPPQELPGDFATRDSK